MPTISTQTAPAKKFVLKQDASKLTDADLIAEFKKRFHCEACEGECQADVMEYCECCGVGKRNGCDLNPSDESIFDGMCDECREKEDECAECCNCGDDVSNDNGTGSLVEGEYWCKTCVEEKDE